MLKVLQSATRAEDVAVARAGIRNRRTEQNTNSEKNTKYSRMVMLGDAEEAVAGVAAAAAGAAGLVKVGTRRACIKALSTAASA
jgi:hypothetical protein